MPTNQLAVGREARGNDLDLGIRGACGARAGAQERGVLKRVGIAASPKWMDVWIVPDLNVLHATFVALDKRGDKARIVVHLRWRRIDEIGFVGVARPRGGRVQHRDDLQVARVCVCHNAIPLVPLKLALARLDVVPGEMLAHQAKTASTNQRERADQVRVRVLFQRCVDAQQRFRARAAQSGHAARLRLHVAHLDIADGERDGKHDDAE